MALFKGVATALITPFIDDQVDFLSLDRLVDTQLAGGVSALLVNGTTGEPTTMTRLERTAVAARVIERVAKRVPVICGAGSNNTYTAIEYARESEELGADAILTVTPYYNKCTQGGLVAHYSAVAEATNLPIIIYNVPSRTGININPTTALKISEIPNVIAIKEANANIEQIMELARLTVGKLDIYSGDDGVVLPLLACGGMGVISVTSNILPQYMSDLCKAYFDNRISVCRDMQFKISPLIKALFSEVNPIPVKTAAYLMGIISSDYKRLPLTPMENIDGLKKALTDFGIHL